MIIVDATPKRIPDVSVNNLILKKSDSTDNLKNLLLLKSVGLFFTISKNIQQYNI